MLMQTDGRRKSHSHAHQQAAGEQPTHYRVPIAQLHDHAGSTPLGICVYARAAACKQRERRMSVSYTRCAARARGTAGASLNDGGGALLWYFETMTDAVFAAYQARGVASREAAIITQAERDADPVPCVGESQFQSQGTIPNWVDLTP